MTDLQDILERADRDGLSARELGRSGGQGLRTAHRWLGGTAVPKLLSFRRMVSRASKLPRSLKGALLDWLVDGSGFAVCEVEEPTLAELDADGSGDLGLRDVYIHLNRAACGLLAAASEAAENGRVHEAVDLTKKAEAHVFKAEATLRRMRQREGTVR